MKRDLTISAALLVAMTWVMFMAFHYQPQPKKELAAFCRQGTNWVMYSRICP